MSDQERSEWICRRERLINELIIAEQVVRFGKIVLKYQNGSYLGMDLHPTYKIEEVIDKPS